MSEYNRKNLPIHFQAWLAAKAPAHVFVTVMKDRVPYVADANDVGRAAYKKWTGVEIPHIEDVEEHKAADIEVWKALKEGDFKTLAKHILYSEEIDGIMFRTIKMPIDENTIMILTHPMDH